MKKHFNWSRVGAAIFCVFLVAMCIISFSNCYNIFNQKEEDNINYGTTTGSGALAVGDMAYVEYTMYIGDTPMITSSLDIFKNSSKNHYPPLLTKDICLIAGQQTDVRTGDPILINLINPPDGCGDRPFRMLNQEYNQIATGIIGLATGESRTIESTGKFFQITYTKERLEMMDIDYSRMNIGDLEIINIPTINNTSNTTTTTIRPGLVTKKTEDKIVLQHGYDTIEMKVTQAHHSNT